MLNKYVKEFNQLESLTEKEKLRLTISLDLLLINPMYKNNIDEIIYMKRQIFKGE